MRRSLGIIAFLVLLVTAGCGSGSTNTTSSNPAAVSSRAAPVTKTRTVAPKTHGSSAAPKTSAATAPGGPVPAGFKAVDLTFVGTEDGWALGTAPCSTKPCTSILRTTDGGAQWVGIPAPKAYLDSQIQSGNSDLDCQKVSCVLHLRFASTTDGYAYDRGSLFMTTDGGEHWSTLKGPGTFDLAAGDGNVIRAVASNGKLCPPGCDYQLQSAPIGSRSFKDLPGTKVDADAVDIERSGSLAIALFSQNPAGGADEAHATLLVSTDGGAKWSAKADPCGEQNTTEYDASQVSVGLDGKIAIGCDPRGTGKPFVLISDNDADSFGDQPALPSQNPIIGLALPGGSPEVLTDYEGPRTGQLRVEKLVNATAWTTTFSAAAIVDGVPFFGFEDDSVGHLLSTPTAEFETTNGGVDWSKQSF